MTRAWRQLAAHCSTVSCPIKITDVMRCKGSSQPEEFFGLEQAQLGLETGSVTAWTGLCSCSLSHVEFACG